MSRNVTLDGCIEGLKILEVNSTPYGSECGVIARLLEDGEAEIDGVKYVFQPKGECMEDEAGYLEDACLELRLNYGILQVDCEYFEMEIGGDTDYTFVVSGDSSFSRPFSCYVHDGVNDVAIDVKHNVSKDEMYHSLEQFALRYASEKNNEAGVEQSPA